MKTALVLANHFSLVELLLKCSTVPPNLPVHALPGLLVVDLHVARANFYPILGGIAQHCAHVTAVRMHVETAHVGRGAVMENHTRVADMIAVIHANFGKLRVLSVVLPGMVPEQFSEFLGGFGARLCYVQVSVG